MNESKPEKHRYWLSFFIRDLEVDEEFKPGLLHITVIPWFVTEKSEPEVVNSFYENFNQVTAMRVKLLGRIIFGDSRRVNVNLVEDDGQLKKLHLKTLDWLAEINGRWAIKNPYVAEEYRPHIRRRRGMELDNGDVVQLSSLYLIKARREEDGLRQVAGKVILS